MISRSIICVTGFIFLSACASTGSGTSANGTTAREQAEVNTALGREYMSRGQFEIALEKLKKATSADPQYAPAHTVLAVLYEQIRQPDLAERHYRQAVKIAPANGDVNNNFGVFLCKSGEFDQAET